MPSSTWIGVKRIVVSCEADSSVPATVSSTLCDQVAGELRKRTSYPVVMADKAADPDPLSDLRMRVKAGVEARNLVVAITPDHRAARSGVAAPAHADRSALSADGQAPGLQAMVARILDKILPPSASASKTRIPQPKKAN
jgi:hypothetical protein